MTHGFSPPHSETHIGWPDRLSRPVQRLALIDPHMIGMENDGWGLLNEERGGEGEVFLHSLASPNTF